MTITDSPSSPGAIRRARFGRAARRHRAELDGLLDTIERAGIHGRGGGSYPAATKLRGVAMQRGTPVIVVNGCEGEPLSHKDRYLLSARADTVLAGALAAARALAADEIVVAVDAGMRTAAEAMARTIVTCPQLAAAGVSADVQAVPSGYVSGQETALIAALSGRAPKPTLAPPYPFQRGVDGRPTLVSNVETFSQIGRAVAGSYDGTRLVTVGGAIADPGLVEITPATTLRQLLETAGGLTGTVSGVLLGGYGGTWVHPDELLDRPLDEFKLREHGLTLGAGIVFMLGEDHCPVVEVARVAHWMAAESAGQCGPCVHGLGAIAGALTELTDHAGRSADDGRVRRWAEMVRRRGACAHPDGVSRFVTTALDVFAERFADHAAQGRCDLCGAAALLPTPPRPASASRPGQRPSR